MLKQFNLEQLVFAEPVIDINEQGEITYRTSGEGWYAIKTEDEINAISASITGAGAVWIENGKLKTSGKAPSVFHIWQNKKWVLSEELQAVKKAEDIAIMRERINALRDAKSAGGVYVEQLGKWFDSDSKAQAKLLGLKATMDLVGEMTVSWTCADNTDVDAFGKPHLTAVIAAILQAENHNHTIAKQHKAAVELADNPLEYDYSGGWSKTYEAFLEEQRNG